MVAAQRENTRFIRGQVVRKQLKLGSVNTWFWALVCARRKKEQKYQLRLDHDKSFSAVHNLYPLCNRNKQLTSVARISEMSPNNHA